MDTVSETLPNGNTIKYRIINGTAYHEETEDAIVLVLENARQSNRLIRLRLCYGDVETGRDWGESCDTTGYIGRSTGSIKIPLMIRGINSTGGGGLLDHCIIRIEWKERGYKEYTEVYRHPHYHK